MHAHPITNTLLIESHAHPITDTPMDREIAWETLEDHLAITEDWQCTKKLADCHAFLTEFLEAHVPRARAQAQDYAEQLRKEQAQQEAEAQHVQHDESEHAPSSS